MPTDSDPREKHSEAAPSDPIDIEKRIANYLQNRVSYPTAQGEPEYVRLMTAALDALHSLRAELLVADPPCLECETPHPRRSHDFLDAVERADRAEAREKALQEALIRAKAECERYFAEKAAYGGYTVIARGIDFALLSSPSEPRGDAPDLTAHVAAILMTAPDQEPRGEPKPHRDPNCEADVYADDCDCLAPEPHGEPTCPTCDNGVLPAATFGLRRDEPCPDCHGSGRSAPPAKEDQK